MVRLRKVVFPDWRKHFDSGRVLNDEGLMFGVTGNTPTVSGPDVVDVRVNGEHDVSAHKVSGLFVRMGVSWQLVIVGQEKLCKQGAFSVNEGFETNAFDGFKIPFWICIREHELSMLRVFKRDLELSMPYVRCTAIRSA